MTKVFYTTYTETKKQSQAGIALLDFVLREYYNIRGYTLCRGENGKPYIEGNPVFFNLSHSGGLVVLAVSCTPVGVDTEPPRVVRRGVVKRFAGVDCEDPAERLFAWMRYESYIKMTGEGIGATGPKQSHEIHTFQVTCKDKAHYICVCTAPGTKCLSPCFVPLP